jgi:Mor family transcriptional regulator
MSEFFRSIAAELVRSGVVSPAIETEILTQQLENLASAYAGGERILIPLHMDRDRRSERNRIIRARFNGHNKIEMAKSFNLTRRQLNNILGKSAP